MKPSSRTLSLIASLSAVGLLAACGSGGGGGSTGTLGVAMTDAPSCGYDEVNVTVTKVRVHKSGSAGENDGGWSDITLAAPKKINLLDLTNGVLEELGTTTLPTGRYTQIRLMLDPNNGNSLANSVVLTSAPTNTTEIKLETPSAVQTGIKLNSTFDVVANERVDLILDFDACKSVVTKGNGGYLLKPVVNVIPTILNGIDGYIAPALLTSAVSVSAQQNGVVIRSTVPDQLTGRFSLARLVPGSYDVVVTANDHATAVVGAVPVATTTSRVALSTPEAPLALFASTVASISGTIALSPSSATEVGYAAAQQSFATGQKVTVKYQGADLSDGTYTVANLPTAAPYYAVYNTTLPIAFTQQQDTIPGTGKYLIEASAPGYVTQSTSSVDITAGNATDINFSLAP